MTANRFDGMFDDDAPLLRRVNEVVIRLHKFDGDDEGPAVVCGSFELKGDVGDIGESMNADDVSFLRKLLDRFGEQVES